MRITLAAVGRAKNGPEAALCGQYLARLPWKAEIVERESKQADPARRKEEEGTLLLAAAAKATHIVALDEAGKELESVAFARHLKTHEGHIAFLLGGADGLSDAVRKRAHLTLSLGKMAWPHLMARAMLCEQIYRAYTILSGHPYHRA